MCDRTWCGKNERMRGGHRRGTKVPRSDSLMISSSSTLK